MNYKSNLDEKFIELAKEDKMPISLVEDLMTEEIKSYKDGLIKHIEKLLMENIDENDLISKKKISGLIKELNLRISEKENLNLH